MLTSRNKKQEIPLYQAATSLPSYYHLGLLQAKAQRTVAAKHDFFISWRVDQKPVRVAQ